MTFGKALKLIKKGKKVTTKSCTSNQYIFLGRIGAIKTDIYFDERTRTQDCLFLFDNGMVDPWIATSSDLLAKDWIEYFDQNDAKKIAEQLDHEVTEACKRAKQKQSETGGCCNA